MEQTQSVKRPPEKVLIMPTTSPTKDQPGPAKSPNGKRPARGRSSLLSIISGDDKKSPKASVSSTSHDEPLSLSVTTSSSAVVVSPTSSKTVTSPINSTAAILPTSPVLGISLTSPVVAISPTSPAVAISPTSPVVAISPASPVVAISPTSPEVAISPTSPEVAISPTNQEVAVSPTSPEDSIFTTSPEVAISPTSPVVAISLTSPEVAISPTSPEVVISPTSQEVAISPTSPEVAISPTSPEVAISPTSPEVAISPTSPKVAVSLTGSDAVTLPTDLETATLLSTSETVGPPNSTSESESSHSIVCKDKVSKSNTDSAKGAEESHPKRTSVKKVPPPTLAKTFKAKPPATAAKPSKRLPSQTSQPDEIKQHSSDILATSPGGSGSSFVEPMDQTLSANAKTTRKQSVDLANISNVAESAVQSASPEVHSSSEPSAAITATKALPEPVSGEMLTSAALHVVKCEAHLPPPELEDLPPPLPANFDLPPLILAPPNAAYETEDIEDMEFPPPPPEVAFSESSAPTLEQNSETNTFQIQEALDKIMSKYDTSSAATGGSEGFCNKTQDTLVNPDLSTKHQQIGDSMQIPIHSLYHSSDAVIASDNDTTTNNGRQTPDEADNVSVKSQTPEIVDTRLNLKLTEGKDNLHSEDSVINEEGTLIINSPTSKGSSGHESIVSGDDGDITHLLTPPKLPATSSFSALEMVSTAPQNKTSSSDQPTPSDQPEPHTAAVVAVMGDNKDSGGKALTVVESTDDSHPTSSSSSAAAHSPPFNTSSESGDSGIETNTYTIIGETVPVKLRPTTNDNRKPDNSVPMFEKYNGDLKRVTFREATNQITPAVTLRRSAAEEEKIKRTGLSEDDVSQAELFYKGHKTEVMVCPCLATLYFAESLSGSTVPVDEWKPVHIGIPVLVYDTGVGKRSQGLTMVFAEKGTGFLLWRSVINYESRWEVVEPVFHRLRISGTVDKLAGIAFQDQTSAESFYNYFKACIADPEKNVLNNPNLRNKKKKEKKKSVKHRSASLPNKSAISMPCQFTHVTQLRQSEDGILALAMIPTDEDGLEDGIVE